ncbi:hypothetical protein NAT51_06895 [Flavobacterium amniphilum]|uniref:hypothetical protein n=1 Tax=Flavobacterium amniphilum TaxID=1834035 RepID=UPI00202A364E|nr:hypothetical protein [Flavobacterium amniphilum]MCL9805240.1 hypothetical protein [Flavobacterium amniphilum]
MAKQKGIIKLSGTLEGVNFYILNGKPVVRKAGGGFNGETIKTKDNMVRVRENSSEFGHCSKVKKQLRLALLPFLTLHHDTGLHGRMVRMLQELKNHDQISERGKRTIGNGLQTEAGRKLFTDFNFTESWNIRNTLNCDINYNPSDYTLTLSRFDISKVKFPASATHLELKFGLLSFDFDNLKYTMIESELLQLNKSNTLTNFILTPKEQSNATNQSFVFCGVRFHQEISGELYPLKGDDAITVSCLGVYP